MSAPLRCSTTTLPAAMHVNSQVTPILDSAAFAVRMVTASQHHYNT